MDLSLATLLWVVWTLAFVVGVGAIAYWASNEPSAQSELIRRMTNPPKQASPRRKMRELMHKPNGTTE